MKCKEILFAFMLILMLTCSLNAQEVPSERVNELDTVLAETLADADEELDSALASDDSDSEETKNEVDEVDMVELDEDFDDQQTGPIAVSVNENGELIGQATADVGGDWVPVEANVALVANGVLLSKIVADQDGSFAFPNVAPGDYSVCGAASSYCGQQAISVQSSFSESVDCQKSVGLQLSQSAQSCCYSELASAPAATFAGGSGAGGFSSGGGFAGGGGAAAGGGGIAGGGGAASGISGLRLLAVGGVATAIAVGVSDDDDDDASPSN